MVGPLIFSFFLFLIVTGERLKEMLEKMEWLQKFGKISYSFYLIHHVILSKAYRLVTEYNMNEIVILIFIFSSSIVAACMMYWGIEVWLKKILNKFLKIV